MRRETLTILLGTTLLAGCGGKQAGSDSAPAPTESRPLSPPPAAKAAATAEKPQSLAAVPVESPPSEPPVRTLLAVYLEADSQGGWRKNEKAATELEKLSADEVRSVWAMLQDEDPQIRRAAAVYLLPLLDPTHPQHVAAFTALLADSDRMVRARGIDGVRQFSRVDQLKTLTQLTPLLDARREDRSENRAAAARLLGSLKEAALDALSSLREAAEHDPDAKVRAAALAAGAAISTATPIVHTLAESLQDADSSVRLVAASRLRQIGASASPAAPALAKALGDQSSEVAEAAAEALIRIGPPAVEPLAAELSTNRTDAKRLALAALIKIGPPSKAAMAAIEKCKQDKDPQVRQLAEAALKRLAAP